MMIKENFTTNIPLEYEDRMKLVQIISAIEDICPSDSNLFFILDREGDKLKSQLKLRSFQSSMDVENEAFDIKNLLDILNNECKKEIKNWRNKRRI